MPQLRAFAICPTCSELYPSFRGCPACDGEPEVASAPVVSAAAEPAPLMLSVDAVEQTHPALRQRAPNLVPYVAALSVAVAVACGLLMAMIAS